MSQEDFLLGLLLAGLTGAVLFSLLGLRAAQRRIRRLERLVAQLGEEVWQPDDSTEIIPQPASANALSWYDPAEHARVATVVTELDKLVLEKAGLKPGMRPGDKVEE